MPKFGFNFHFISWPLSHRCDNVIYYNVTMKKYGLILNNFKCHFKNIDYLHNSIWNPLYHHCNFPGQIINCLDIKFVLNVSDSLQFVISILMIHLKAIKIQKRQKLLKRKRPLRQVSEAVWSRSKYFCL